MKVMQEFLENYFIKMYPKTHTLVQRRFRQSAKEKAHRRQWVAKFSAGQSFNDGSEETHGLCNNGLLVALVLLPARLIVSSPKLRYKVPDRVTGN